MPLRVLNLEPFWYTPKAEAEAKAKAKDPNYVPSEFLLGAMLFKDRAHVENLLNAGEQIGEVVSYIMVRYLRGWRHVLDANGAEIKFDPEKNGHASQAQLQMIPWPWSAEMALEVKRRADLTEAERKNFGSLST